VEGAPGRTVGEAVCFVRKELLNQNINKPFLRRYNTTAAFKGSVAELLEVSIETFNACEQVA
jgi:hypothetical protein